MLRYCVRRVTDDVFLTVHFAILFNLRMVLWRFTMVPDPVLAENACSSYNHSGAYSGAHSGRANRR